MLFSGISLNFNQRVQIVKYLDLVYRDWLVLVLLLLFSIFPGVRSDMFINILDNNYYFSDRGW
jgi:hypothetical protein